MTALAPPQFAFETEGGRTVLTVSGDWTVSTIGPLDAALREQPERTEVPVLDVSKLGRLDTAGAFLIDRTLRHGCAFEDPPIDMIGDHANADALIRQARASSAACDPEPTGSRGLVDLLERTGKGSVHLLEETRETLAFLGEAVVTCGRVLLNPRRFRSTATVAVMEEAGLDAMPIVAFLSFFVGMVIAFMGATTLASIAGGAELFTVELVGVTVLREFGVVITAIILAGRTNSAFTAQIGSMKMRQEVDAITTLGLKPMEVIVAPRIFAMLVMTPILTLVGVLAGLFGGLMVCWLALDINPAVFASRIQTFVPIENFWVGVSKAPIFGFVVAMIGCRQGLAVGGNVQSLGEKTTKSVVQALFAIIVIDAVFAIFYMELGI